MWPSCNGSLPWNQMIIIWLLDLKDVTLVDPDAVKFLARWEADGIKFENCPAYVREWIERERSRSTGRKSERSN